MMYCYQWNFWLFVRIVAGLAVTLAAAADDIKRYKISNRIVTGGGFTAIVMLICEGISKNDVLDYVMGSFAAFGLMLAAYAVHAVGAGDVKLTAVLGCIAGVRNICVVIAGAFICAGIMGIIGVLLGKCRRMQIYIRRRKNNKEGGHVLQVHTIHFSVALLAGEIVMFCCIVMKGG